MEERTFIFYWSNAASLTGSYVSWMTHQQSQHTSKILKATTATGLGKKDHSHWRLAVKI